MGIHLTGIGPLDLILLCASIAFVTMLLAIVVNHIFTGWDERVLMWFSRVASTPKWSIAWVLIFLAWLPLRELLIEHWKWFAGDGDLVVLTILWSVGPFMVENAMKYSNARQMAALEAQNTEIVKQNSAILDLTTAVRAALDRGEERDDVMHALLVRLLDAIEEPKAVL